MTDSEAKVLPVDVEHSAAVNQSTRGQTTVIQVQKD
jgi:1-deoxy-D-xylulose 5-phosphate reductoisomerase